MNREGVWPSLLKTDEVTLNLTMISIIYFFSSGIGGIEKYIFLVCSARYYSLCCIRIVLSQLAFFFFFSITQFIVSQYISICSVFTWSHRKLNSESNSASSCKLSFTLLSGYVSDIKRVTVCTNSQEQF